MPRRHEAVTRTRCPACRTVFRVTSEQLRAKAGKVRCGHCQALFNAFDHLVEETPVLPPAAALADQSEAVAIPPEEHHPMTESAGVEVEGGEHMDSRLRGNDGEFHVEPEPEPEFEPESEPEPEPEPEIEADAVGPQPDLDEVAKADEAAEEEIDELAEIAKFVESAEIAPVDASTATDSEAPAAEAPETPEESTRAAREAGLVAARDLAETPAYNRWAASPLAGDTSEGFASDAPRLPRWPFVAAALLLSVVLAGQLAYRFRSDLIRSLPVAEDVFAMLGVAVPLPQRSELVSIESSDLQADNGRGLLVLNAVLRNRAGYAQAWPALELTLTDAQDTVVARRVLAAADYLQAGGDDKPFPAGAEIPVRLWINAKGLGAAGYRIYIFYP